MTAVPFTDGHDTVADIVRGIVARMAGRESVSDHDHLWNDLAITIEARNDMLQAIETRLELSLPEAVYTHTQTVGSLIAMVEEETETETRKPDVDPVTGETYE